MSLEMVKYEEKYADKWDRLVLNESVNGTFLQTRNFLNYHPEGRFQDASVLVMQGSNIVAVIPACDVEDEGKRCFFSHKGSTFGGIVIDRKKYNISILDELIPALDGYLIEEGFEIAILKTTSAIFAERPMDLQDYYLFKNGYNQFDEISFYVDIKNAPTDLLSILSTSRRRDYRYSLKNDLQFKRLVTEKEIAEFYEILKKNLMKFDSKPVHTLDELLEFKNHRLSDVVDFYGVFLGDRMVAGTMLFYFADKVVHTQYLAQDLEYANLMLMNFMDYNLLELTREKNFDKFSFGISTEERGKVLNKGLALFKEGFGCNYCVNRSYVKTF